MQIGRVELGQRHQPRPVQNGQRPVIQGDEFLVTQISTTRFTWTLVRQGASLISVCVIGREQLCWVVRQPKSPSQSASRIADTNVRNTFRADHEWRPAYGCFWEAMTLLCMPDMGKMREGCSGWVLLVGFRTAEQENGCRLVLNHDPPGNVKTSPL
jgi:hypothetical protein